MFLMFCFFSSLKKSHLDSLYFKRQWLKLVIESLILFGHDGAPDVGFELLEADHPVVVVVILRQPLAHLTPDKLINGDEILY